MTYQNDIRELKRLHDENMENIFHIYQDNDDRYFYNLLQTIHFPQDLPASYFQGYNITYGDTWPYISYKVYGNIKLWWVLMLANNIINPIEQPEPGTTIRVPTINVVNEILTQLVTSKE